jgi:heme-degrading monooxygenase HmoA
LNLGVLSNIARSSPVLVVIFRARIRLSDPEYSATANRLRQLALSEFGCLEFHAATEGTNEIALSYWPDEESIRAWRAHPEHVKAQKRGREMWYESFSVEVAEVGRAYKSPG